MPQVTIGTTPVDVAVANAKRMTLTLRNESAGTQKIYFWLQDAKGLITTNADYILRIAEEKTFILFFDGPDVRNPVAAVADGAGATLIWAETAER